jgi:hypothetical protein
LNAGATLQVFNNVYMPKPYDRSLHSKRIFARSVQSKTILHKQSVLAAYNRYTHTSSASKAPSRRARIRLSGCGASFVASRVAIYRVSFNLLFSHRHIAFALVQPRAANPNIHVLHGYANCNYADRNILFPIII